MNESTKQYLITKMERSLISLLYPPQKIIAPRHSLLWLPFLEQFNPTSLFHISPSNLEDFWLPFCHFFPLGALYIAEHITSAPLIICNPVFEARVISCKLHHATWATKYCCKWWCLTWDPRRRKQLILNPLSWYVYSDDFQQQLSTNPLSLDF